MLATTILIATALGLLMGHVVLYTLFLRLGLRWAKVGNAPLRRLVVASALLVPTEIILGVLVSLPSPSTTGQEILFNLTGLVLVIAVSCSIISRFFSIGLARSLQAWLPTALSSVIGLMIAVFVIRPYLFESFVSPTNAMAPTLLGPHWRSACPDCGRPNFCSPVEYRASEQEPLRMICEDYHVRQTLQGEHRTYPGDHFFVAKFIAPQRWDLVVFRYPEHPSTLYVMRLVGLPGETIHIEDGAVWADGVKLEIPENLKGIGFFTEFSGCIRLVRG